MDSDRRSQRIPNHELQAARLAVRSRTTGHPLTRGDLAELVRAWLAEHRNEHAAIDEVYVGKLERGEVRWPAERYRTPLRHILGVTTDSELGFYRRADGATLSDVDRREFMVSAAAVMISGSAKEPEALLPTSVAASLLGATDLDRLRLTVDRATRLERASQYSALAAVIPWLVSEGGRLSAEARPSQEQDVAALQSCSEALNAWLLIKRDQPTQAELAASRALDVALGHGEDLLVAAAMRCLAEAHMRAGNLDLACDLGVEAAEVVRRSGIEGADALCLRGAAFLSAAMACARGGAREGAYELLGAADRVASEIGRDMASYAVFGPSNVAVHRVAVPIELGDAALALEQAEAAEVSFPAGMAERRARYLLDVARAHVQLSQDEAAVGTLLAAEGVAPEEIRTHRLTGPMLTDLLGRESRTKTPELRDLAARCGVLADA